MEKVSKSEFIPSIDKLNNNEECQEEDFQSCSKSVSNTVKSEYFQSVKVTQDCSQKRKGKSVKISSILDSYCKTNDLDESSDFIKCDSQTKLKSVKSEPVKNSQSENIICEICKDDITNLDEYNQAVHVNNCIDKQTSSAPESRTHASESDVVFILECPLCFKHFSSPELRSNHIKKCGKSKGLSLQSIIKALQLQEKHALERISLGLPVKPAKPTKSHKSAASKKAIVEPKNKAQSDLQLAKALSLSLKDSNKQNEEASSENITFVTLKPPTAHQQPGKKNKKNVTPLLVLRTEEERKKLLLDKVATIVTPKNVDENDLSVKTENDISEKENENPNQIPLLWQLCGKALDKQDYYVENLLDWIQPTEVEVGANFCHLSQIPGHEIVTQLPCDYTFESQDSEKQTFLESSKPVDPVTSLTDSLRSLVASSWMSDVDIQTACGTILPAHRLLLAVRCPPLKQDLDFCSKVGRVLLKWEDISFDAALQFLNFIYTGKIELGKSMKTDLLHLANKYDVSDLKELLFTNERGNIYSEVDNKTVSENQPFAFDSRCREMEVDPNEEASVDYSKEKLFNCPKDTVYEMPPCSPSQVVEESENGFFSETQDCNMDLEIVYNCINSSLKPSQPSVNNPFSLTPTTSSQSKSRSESLESESFLNSSKRCTVDNCALPDHKSPASPVIFDVIESESEVDINSDSESVELPVNCSQKSVLGKLDLEEEKLELCSTESNSSQDSVKFLSSSFSLHNSLVKTPVKEKSASVSASPKLLLSPLNKISSPLREIRDPKKSFAECIGVTIDDSVANEFHSNNYASLESPPSFHFRYSSFHYTDEVQNIVDNDAKELHEASAINVITDNANEVESAGNMDISFSNENIDFQRNSLKNSPQKFDSDLRSGLKLLELYPTSQSNCQLSPKISGCEGLSLLQRNTTSPEVLICDSDSSSESSLTRPSKLFACSQQFNNSFQSPVKSSFSAECIKNSTSNSPVQKKLFEDQKSENEDSFVLQLPSTSSASSCFVLNASPVKANAESAKIKNDGSEEGGVYSNNELLRSDENKVVKNLSSPEFSTFTQVGPSRLSPVDLQYECNEYFEPDVLSPPKNEETKKKSPGKKSLKKKSNKGAEEIRNNGAATPSSQIQPQFLLTDSPITPFPDYKNMVTPQIREALRRIGVKALPRKKAIALLSHVYNETHPLINGEMQTENCSPTKISKTEKIKKRKKVKEDVSRPSKKQQIGLHSSETTSATQDSDDSDSENPKWQGCVPEISFTQGTQDSPTKPNKDDIDLIKQYIQSNEELYNNVLTYVPLNLITLQLELKDNGLKISIPKLMDFLDEQCITFTCPRKEEYRKKQTARAQRFRKNMIAKLSQQTS